MSKQNGVAGPQETKDQLTMARKKNVYTFALLIFCLTINLPSIGHSPVFGINTRYMPKGKWGYQFKNIYLMKDGGKDTIDLRSTVMYGVTNKLTVDLALPYLLRFSAPKQSAGIGDVAFKLNYSFYLREEENSKLHLFILDLIRFPTGDSSLMPDLGTGTYRNRIGLTCDYDAQWYGIYAASVYEHSLNKYKDLRPGDLFELTLTMEAKPAKNWSCMTSIDYYVLLKDSKNGVSDLDSGGNILYIGPEVYYQNEHIKVSGSVQIPAFRSKLKQSIRAGFFLTAYF